jgi:tetratricopeptide (TPR) repeat protein
MKVRKRISAFFLLGAGVFSCAGAPAIDSLKRVLERMPDDTGKVSQLNRMSRQLEINAEYDEAINSARLALETGLKIGYTRGIADAYNAIGNGLMGKGDHMEARHFYARSLVLRKELLDRARLNADDKALKEAMKGMAVAYNNLGLIDVELGNYPESIKSYFVSVKIKEELLAGAVNEKDSLQTALLNKSIATSYNNLGNVYYSQEDYVSALQYYELALGLRKQFRDKRGIARTLDGIGKIFDQQGNYEEGLKNHFEALAIFLELGDRQSEAYCRQLIGIDYKCLGNLRKAMEFHLLALEIEKEIGDQLGIAISYTNLGQLSLMQQKIAEAKRYFGMALAIDKETNNKNNMKFLYKGLADADSAEGNFAQALLHYKLYIAYRDSLVNEENTKKTVQTQMQYEFDKQQAADSIRNAEQLKQESLKHDQEIQQQLIYTYGGVIGFVLMLVVAGVSFNAYRQKQKANAIISGQKALVEDKQREILDSIYYARRIQQSLMPTEKYIERILQRLNRG